LTWSCLVPSGTSKDEDAIETKFGILNKENVGNVPVCYHSIKNAIGSMHLCKDKLLALLQIHVLQAVEVSDSAPKIGFSASRALN
jgi:hypothetical protein